jgi:hypothetical protein
MGMSNGKPLSSAAQEFRAGLFRLIGTDGPRSVVLYDAGWLLDRTAEAFDQHTEGLRSKLDEVHKTYLALLEEKGAWVLGETAELRARLEAAESGFARLSANRAIHELQARLEAAEKELARKTKALEEALMDVKAQEDYTNTRSWARDVIEKALSPKDPSSEPAAGEEPARAAVCKCPVGLCLCGPHHPSNVHEETR